MQEGLCQAVCRSQPDVRRNSIRADRLKMSKAVLRAICCGGGRSWDSILRLRREEKSSAKQMGKRLSEADGDP